MKARTLAFTLLETLVVIGILVVLMALVVPALQKARNAAELRACASQMRQIGTAIHVFHTDHGHVPPPRQTTYNISWMAHLLPYIEEGALWRETQAACQIEPRLTYSLPPHTPMTHVVKLYVCPLDSFSRSAHVDEDGIEAGLTSYLGVSGYLGLDGVMTQPISVAFSDIHDGLSNTLMVGERPPPEIRLAGWWYSFARPMGVWNHLYGPDFGMIVNSRGGYIGDPCQGPFLYGPGRADNPCDRYHFWSYHSGGANWLFADASVRFLAYRIGRPLLPELATRSGSEPPVALD